MQKSVRFQAGAVLLLSLCCVLAFGRSAFCAEKILCVYDRGFVPLAYERNQKALGFEADVLRAALQYSSYEPRFEAMDDWSKAQQRVSGGEAKVALGMTRTPIRDKVFLFPKTPSVDLNLSFFVRSSEGMHNVNDIRGHQVGTLGDTLYERLLESFGGVSVRRFETEDEGLTALKNGEVDAFFGADRIIRYHIQRDNISGLKTVGIPLAQVPVYFAVHRHTPKLRDAIEQGLERILENGRYDKLFRKWFVRELSPKQKTQLLTAAQKARGARYLPGRGHGEGAAVLMCSGKMYSAGSLVKGPTQDYSPLESALLQAAAAGNLEVRAVTVVKANGEARVLSAKERKFVRHFGRDVLVLWDPSPGTHATWMITQMLPYSGKGASRQ
ncbi:transporter substrate-binding domain-containing protein [Desulfobaculum bizertense]|uniref:Cytidine deaminase n=1 Tax=Desulfobaculum bizertense DSM 18034 TaxID=1121442 RepID=A0A1T4VKI3_9BACT|nr:transporter substrate-binding domain-containing protein [Desulfobaculum bizertense]SKA65449.1 cytidine deaminase [Desulfobaculum bizertense DSM 18034]